MKALKSFKLFILSILCLSILVIFITRDKHNDVEEGLTHRLFYGTVSEVSQSDEEKSFKIWLSELKKSEITFVFTDDTLYGEVAELHKVPWNPILSIRY